MTKKKLVMIGNGMAGVRTIEDLLKNDPDGFDITIFGKEPYPNYNRIQLSSVLQGNTELDDIVLNDWDWYEKNEITLYTGEKVTAIDRDQKVVYSDQDRSVPYDKLILATGSNPFILPLPGVDKEGVIAFRDIQDCQTMIETSEKYQKAVVIGGGLLGLEAARGLLNLNMDVSVVHLMDHLMERQLDPTASKMLQAELESQGMHFLMQKQTSKIIGKKRVSGVVFKDGSMEKADLVVMAVGIRPNIDLANECGLQTNRGVVVNDYLQTSDPDIYAVGECAEHREIAYGLVAPLFEQAGVLARSISGADTEPYTGSVTSTQLKVSGVDVFSAGEFHDDPGTKALRIHDESEGIYKKLIIRDNKITGAVLFGDTSDGQRIFSMMNSGQDISEMQKFTLLSSGDGASNEASAAAMAAGELVCGCNGVSKGTIMDAIQNQDLKTVEEIKNATNASRSCGSCKPLVGQLLEHALGDDYDPDAAEREPVCGCTTLTRDELLEEIRDKGLQTIKEVMNVLEWKNEEGCSTCRPALNYYLGMLFPEEYEDDQASRFVNERNHANIQNDGTYSVVPRMYGGVTNPDQLRKIADVAEKYDAKMVKVTGGQRLDLLGLKKEDLPKVWDDLGMPSGYAYAKAIRTVKTCVGTDFCRFGTQDAISMGIDIEKKFERLNTPHKVKMAVSGCPRNCAESGIKDLGVVGVEGGWELYVGGNGGATLRGGDFLCSAETEEEVLAMTGAYLQYYRETAKYRERTSFWVERMGLDHIREVVEDPKQRQVLNERVDKALSVLEDPWKKRVEDPEWRSAFEKVEVE